MTRSTFVNRRAAGILTAALTVGFAGPAAARPFDIDAAGSFVPAATGQVQAVAVAPTSSHSTSGNSGLEDVLIATGGAAVALVGLGGTRAASRRRRQTGAVTRPTIAA